MEQLHEKCGTHAGYQSHKYRKEEVCQPCQSARAEYKKAYYLKNRDQLLAYRREWYLKNIVDEVSYSRRYYVANVEKAKEYGKAYREANLDKVREAERKWRIENPDKKRRLNNKRRAQVLENGHEFYTEQQVIETYGSDCHICLKEIVLEAPRKVGALGWEQSLHIDHLVPISKGGADTLDNVRPTHGLCNIRKHATILEN